MAGIAIDIAIGLGFMIVDRIINVFEEDDKMDQIDKKLDNLNNKLDRNKRVMERGFKKSLVEIKRNFREIKKNFKAIREVSSKLDRNFDKMIELFAETKKTLEKIDKNVKIELDALRKSIKETRIETETSAITFAIERLMTKNILIFHLNKQEIPIFFEGSQGIDWFVKTKEILHETLHNMIENSSKYVIPENEDDEIAFKGLEVLIMGLKAYNAINLNLINSYIYMAKHHYNLNNIDTFNNYLLTLASTIKDFEINFIGVDINVGLIRNVKNILNRIENLDFIRYERLDIIQTLSETEKNIDKFKIEFSRIKSQLSLMELKPAFEIKYDFSRSNLSTPFRDWTDRKTVSYALQLKNQTEFSQISDWSTEYEIFGKACPFLKLKNNYTKEYECVVFRKFSNGKEEIVSKFSNLKQNQFRDIERDLFDGVIKNANEELAIKNLNLLLKNDANINVVYENGKSLIHYIIENDQPNLLLELIKNNASINIADKDGRQPIHIATEKNSEEMVKILLYNRAHVNAKTNLNWTPIHYAFKNGNENMTSLLIEKGADITIKTEDDFNVFHIASSSDKPYMINSNKFKSVDINAKSTKGLTALHISIIAEHISSIETLLNNSQIDVNTKSQGLAPLHLAASSENPDIIKKLLQHRDINVNQITSDNWTALHLSLMASKEEIAIELLNHKDIDINLEGQSKLTALHLATRKNMTKVVSELIQKKARLEKLNSNGLTSLHIAANYGYRDIAEILVYDGKVCLNVKDNEGLTPLMQSVLNDQFRMVDFLIQQGARINEVNKKGYNAIELSAWAGNIEIFQYLKKKAVNQKISYTLNSLKLASLNNQQKIIQIMVNDENENILEFRDSKRNTILHHAASGGNFEMMKFLLETPFNLTSIANEENEEGNDIFHISAANQNFKLTRYLYRKNLDIRLNSINNDWNTFILEAAKSKAWPIVEFLLKDDKIDFKRKNKDGNSILHYSAYDNQRNIIDYLLNNLKLEIDDLNEDLWSPLSFSVISGHLELAKYLIERKNANYHLLSKNHYSLTHLASSSGNLDLLKYLVEEKGLNVISQEKTTSCLHLSAQHGHLDLMKYLLIKQSNIDAIDENGNTPLSIGAKMKNWKIVEYLIKQNANTELFDNENNTIIHEIAKSNRIDLLELLKNKKISQLKRAKNFQGRTALHNSCLVDDNLEMTKYLVEELNFIFDQDHFGNTPAHYSALISNFETTIYLAKKFFIDILNLNGKTPCTITEDLRISKHLIEKQNADYSKSLFKNTINNSLGVLKYLIEILESDPNQIDENGQNILIRSAYLDHLNIVQYLVREFRINIGKTDKLGRNATYYADLNYKEEVYLYLISMDNEFLQPEPPKQENIFQAVDEFDLNAVKYFIRFKGCGPNQKDVSKNSLLHLASEKENDLKIVKYLVSIGADLYSKNSQGNLPLHEAANSGALEILKYFLDLKMDPNLKGKSDFTILDFALNRGHFEMTKFIVENTPLCLNLRNKDDLIASMIDFFRKNKDIYKHLKCHISKYCSESENKIKPSIKSSKLLSIENSKIHKLAIENQKSKATLDIQFPDLNGTLVLANVLIRKVTNKKFIADYEKKLSFIDAKIFALNIVNSFEKILETTSKNLKISFDDFDPIRLISSLTGIFINGNLDNIPKILIKSIENNFKHYEKNHTLKNQIKEQLENSMKKILVREFKSIEPIKSEPISSLNSSNIEIFDFSSKSNDQFKRSFEVERIEN